MAENRYQAHRLGPDEQERIEEMLAAGEPCLLRARCALGSALDCSCYVAALVELRAAAGLIVADRRRFTR